jgi:hypothetical protein
LICSGDGTESPPARGGPFYVSHVVLHIYYFGLSFVYLSIFKVGTFFSFLDQLLSAYRKKDSPKKVSKAPQVGSPTAAKPPKQEQPWMSVKPAADSDAWLLPAGKSFLDFFTENDQTFLAPHTFIHHMARKKLPICLWWISTGKCTASCWCAHIQTKQISNSEITAMDTNIIALYRTK